MTNPFELNSQRCTEFLKGLVFNWIYEQTCMPGTAIPEMGTGLIRWVWEWVGSHPRAHSEAMAITTTPTPTPNPTATTSIAAASAGPNHSNPRLLLRPRRLFRREKATSLWTPAASPPNTWWARDCCRRACSLPSGRRSSR